MSTDPTRIPIAATGPAATSPPRHRRHPDWLKVKLPGGHGYERLRGMLHGLRLNTVCEEALCPNVGECWGQGTATFMILGNICTRGCRYCAVDKGHPVGLDREEPERVAEAVERMGLRHAVVTSVDRDDLMDGGAEIFAATIRAIRARVPACAVEVLIPDFQGREESLSHVLAARPDVLNHNIETVPRLFPRLRPQGRYEVSLDVLAAAKGIRPAQTTKSGLMVGLGETDEEVESVLGELRAVGVDIVTIGQYLRPSRRHEPVHRYVPPEGFAGYESRARALGFPTVHSGVFVRSSYGAEDVYREGGRH
jgi:lipoic acid synthetase